MITESLCSMRSGPLEPSNATGIIKKVHVHQVITDFPFASRQRSGKSRFDVFELTYLRQFKSDGHDFYCIRFSMVPATIWLRIQISAIVHSAARARGSRQVVTIVFIGGCRIKEFSYRKSTYNDQITWKLIRVSTYRRHLKLQTLIYLRPKNKRIVSNGGKYQSNQSTW